MWRCILLLMLITGIDLYHLIYLPEADKETMFRLLFFVPLLALLGFPDTVRFTTRGGQRPLTGAVARLICTSSFLFLGLIWLAHIVTPAGHGWLDLLWVNVWRFAGAASVNIILSVPLLKTPDRLYAFCSAVAAGAGLTYLQAGALDGLGWMMGVWLMANFFYGLLWAGVLRYLVSKVFG